MADNLLPGRYAVGAASVDVGGTIVSPTGATWTDNVWGDDLFFLPSQPLVPPQRVETVNEDGEIVLAYPWPGAAATEEPYEVRFVGMIERSTAQSRKVLEQLGDVKAWYDIIVVDDASRLALETASNPLRAGYRVLVRDDGVIWAKKSSAFGDWIGPVEFKGDIGNKGWSPVFVVVADGARRVLQLAGWVGGEGAAPAGVGRYVGAAGLVDDIAQAIDIRGEGFQWSGAYNAANAYAKGSVVRLNGSAFIALQAVPIGEQPSGTYPPIDTAYWGVLASKGQDGTGTGDMVGPPDSGDDEIVVFNGTSGKQTKRSGKTVASLVAIEQAIANGMIRKDQDQNAQSLSASAKINILKNTLQAWEQIGAEVAVGTAVAQIDWAGLTAYRDLRIRGRFVATATSVLAIRIGAGAPDAASNYTLQALAGSGSTVSAAIIGPSNGMQVSGATGITVPTNFAASVIIDLFEFNRPFLTRISCQSGSIDGSGQYVTYFNSGLHLQSLVCDTVRLLASAGSIGAGSYFNLEGRRG